MYAIINKSEIAQRLYETCAILTDCNQHTEALMSLAAVLPDCEHEQNALMEINRLHLEYGSICGANYQRRQEIANRLWKRARAFWLSDVDYNKVRSAF